MFRCLTILRSGRRFPEWACRENFGIKTVLKSSRKDDADAVAANVDDNDVDVDAMNDVVKSKDVRMSTLSRDVIRRSAREGGWMR